MRHDFAPKADGSVQCVKCKKVVPLYAPIVGGEICEAEQLYLNSITQLREGTKNDDGKIRLDLLSSQWLFGVGDVLTFGAKKYDAHNWRKGIKFSRLLGACLRHVVSFLGGEDKDPETGLSHLLHASCCLMFAFELHETTKGWDDRYKAKSSENVDIKKDLK